MKIAPAWLHASSAQRVIAVLTKAGHKAYFVGGCVRDAVMGLEASDIDIATSALPETSQALAEADGLRVVPTGLSHGTITVLCDGQPFEVTTFRRDVETDGRHARVAFTEDLGQDAARRDFTMNAVYADAAGAVIDPTGFGVADAQAGHVRFVGDPHQRIAEDYLRILRFFRFHARFSAADAGFEAEALAAISEHAEGLDTISRERIGSEMRKLLDAQDPSVTVATMAAIGVLARILTGADPAAIARLVSLEADLSAQPDWLRRLAALTGNPAAAEALRLSKAQSRTLEVLQNAARDVEPAHVLGYRHGQEAAVNALLVRAALTETSLSPDAPQQAARGAKAEFPIKPADLAARFEGPALGQALRDREKAWIDSGFKLSREKLLS